MIYLTKTNDNSYCKRNKCNKFLKEVNLSLSQKEKRDQFQSTSLSQLVRKSILKLLGMGNEMVNGGNLLHCIKK